MDKIKRIQELTNQLNTYRNEYYNLNHPSVSDAEYDSLFNELHTLESQTGFVLSNSPTQTVGYEVVSKLQKVEHSVPLLSLDKTKSIDELNKFMSGKEVLIMLKADGLTVELIYENGVLKQASTRGNGHIGEDITSNAKVFKGLPLKINWKGRLKITGEAVIHKDDFEEINSKLSDDEKYATPRNLTSGSVRQLDSKICSERNVCFYAFALLESDMEFIHKHKQFEWLDGHGFNVVPYIVEDLEIREHTIENLKISADVNNIPIDGMVISYNNVKYAESCGATNHHKLDAIAFKFGDETEETILRSVEWNTTRSGQINPTACFDTVILDNTEVSRASLFNLNFIKDLQLNLLNRVLVSKRNMIIPYIEDNLDRQEGNYIPIPKQCPSCGQPTEIRNTGTADFLYCINDDCPAKQLDKFVNFVKRDAMNIEGLSEATLEKLINKGWLQKFDDIYYLDEHKSEIIKMDGFGLKSYNNLIESIEKSKNVKLENFFTSLGIEEVGVSTGKLLAKRFKTIDNFLNANRYDFLSIEGIGDITANSIYEYRLLHIGTIQCLRNKVNIIEETKKDTGYKNLTGLTFVITGSVNTFKNRDEFKVLVESLNGKVAGSVSNKTNYLVNNDVNSTSGKNKTAKELGVKIISEMDFNTMIGRSI